VSAPGTWYRVARGMEVPEEVTVARATDQYVWLAGDDRRTPKDGVTARIVPTVEEAWVQLVSWARGAVKGAQLRLETERGRLGRVVKNADDEGVEV
jgi:hypothetical protein